MTPTSHPDRWRILFVLSTALLLIAMDATILNVALPAIAADLEPGSTELLWIVDAYGLVLAGLLVAMGGLGDRIGRRRLLSAGLVVFGLASALAAAAPSPEALIAARVLLGVGGAMIMPSTLSTLRVVFTDARERSIAIGVWSAVAAGGFALGPVVGGALLEVADWHLVLAINVPIMAAALVASRRWVPESRNPAPGPWDPVAVGLSVVGMVAFVWGIKHGGEHGFTDVAALAAIAAGVAVIGEFVRRQLRTPQPLLDVALFRDARFSGAVTAVLFTFLGYRSALELPAGTPDAAADTAREGLATLAGAAGELGPTAARCSSPHGSRSSRGTRPRRSPEPASCWSAP